MPSTVATDIPVGAGWSFQPNGVASEKDQQRRLPPGLDQSKDVLKSVAIWLRIANAAERLGWRVVKAACHPYQEQYDLVGPNGEQCQLRIPYNGKNVVTAMHVKEPPVPFSMRFLVGAPRVSREVKRSGTKREHRGRRPEMV